MSIKQHLSELIDVKPRLTVVGVGGAGCNAVNNMIAAGLQGVEFVVANTDAQSLAVSSAEHRIQLGTNLTEGLGAGSRPEIGEAAAEEAIEDIRNHIAGSHMVFVAAGMGGGTGTGAAAVVARAAREAGALTVGIVCKPFQFEGARRMRMAEAGIQVLRQNVDTLIVIPNQNLFRIANERTTFAEAFVLADQVLYSGVACIVELVLKEGLINLDFADVRSVMSGMGTAMMGTGEAAGEGRAVLAAEEAIANPLLDDVTLQGAKGLLLSITGGRDLTLYEVDEAASRVRQEVDPEANIIVGATFDENLGDRIRVSIVASGMGAGPAEAPAPLPPKNKDAAKPAQGSSKPSPQAAAAVTAKTAVAAVSSAPYFPHPEPQTLGAPPAVVAAASNGAREMQRRLTEVLQAAQPEADYGRGTQGSELHDQIAATRQSWVAPGNVMIDDGYQSFHSDASGAGYSASAGGDGHQSAAQSFQPAPPMEMPRSASRLQGQHTYPADPTQDWSSRPSSGAAASQPAQSDGKRPGLLGRLTGMGKSASESKKASKASSAEQSTAHGGNLAFPKVVGDIRR